MKANLAVVSLAVVLTTSAFAETATLVNPGFESNWTSAGRVGADGHVTFYYNPTGTDMGWAFAEGGVASSYDALQAYEGSRFAVLQLWSSISQSFTVASDSSATLDFALVLRPGYATGQTVGVYIDGNQVGNYTAQYTGRDRWTLEHANLGNLTSGSHVLQFKGNAIYAQTGDTTAYLDAVRINVSPVPEPETYGMLMAGLGLVSFVARRKKRCLAASPR